MAKYRKKPIIIEAVQWKNGLISELTPWIKEGLNKLPQDKGSIMRRDVKL